MTQVSAVTKRNTGVNLAGVDRNNFVRLGDLNDLRIENLTVGNLNAPSSGAALTLNSTLSSPTIMLDLKSNLATRADGDTSRIRWYFDNDAGASTEYARMDVVATDVSSGSENAEFQFSIMDQGTIRNVFQVSSSSAGIETFDLQGATDMTMADGSLTIIDGDNASTLSVTNNTITTSDAMVDISSTSISTGALMRLNANTTAHDGEVLELINAGDGASTGVGLSVTMPDVTTGAARGIDVTMALLTTTGFGIRVTMDAVTTGDMLYLDNGGATMTGDGKFINCNDDDTSLFAIAAGGAATWTLGAGITGITLDAGTTAHTAGAIISADVNVNSADVQFINADINVTTALTGSEIVYGSTFDVEGLAADADGTAIVGYHSAMHEVTTGRADTTGFLVDIQSIRDTADTDAGLAVDFTGTLNDSGATWYGVRVSDSTATYTDGQFYGLYVNHISASSADVTGVNILIDTIGSDNTKLGIAVTKDLINATATAAGISNTQSALKIFSTNATSGSANDVMTISGQLTTVQQANSTTLALADIYSGTVMGLSYSATTSGAGTATSSATGLNITYKVIETAGTLNLTAFNVANIDFDTTGTPSYASGAYNLLNINGTDAGVPAYAATGIISAVNVDLSGMDVSDADLTLYGLHLNMPASPTSTMAHIRAEETLITDMPVPAPGAGFDAAGGVLYIPFGKNGVSGMFVTEWYVDLGAAGVGSITTVNDVIGETGGGAAYIGQITAANHGTVVAVEVVCVEAPTTGDTDIDFSAATAADAIYSDDITAEAGYSQLLAAGAAWTVGRREVFTALPAINTYIYLSSGAGGTTGAYGAGKFIIRIYGT